MLETGNGKGTGCDSACICFNPKFSKINLTKMVFTSEMDKEFNLGYMIPQEHAMVRDRADCYSYKAGILA
jgi:hypothetical protein